MECKDDGSSLISGTELIKNFLEETSISLTAICSPDTHEKGADSCADTVSKEDDVLKLFDF